MRDAKYSDREQFVLLVLFFRQKNRKVGRHVGQVQRRLWKKIRFRDVYTKMGSNKAVSTK